MSHLRTTIEYFDGPHQIHGAGTFEFLKQHLNHNQSTKSATIGK